MTQPNIEEPLEKMREAVSRLRTASDWLYEDYFRQPTSEMTEASRFDAKKLDDLANQIVYIIRRLDKKEEHDAALDG